MNLLGGMTNKDVLELGCGAATLAKKLAPSTRSYTGINGSQKMLELALKNLAGIPNVKLTHASLETYDFKKETDDCIFSQLTLHYLEDFKQICENIYNSLRTGGEFVFSVQHPVLTSAFISGGGKRENWGSG
ncbi:class I SAM-dependent DNA methyltransferase [Cytobacillus kochii]